MQTKTTPATANYCKCQKVSIYIDVTANLLWCPLCGTRLPRDRQSRWDIAVRPQAGTFGRRGKK